MDSEYLLLPVLTDPNIYLSYDPNLDCGINTSSGAIPIMKSDNGNNNISGNTPSTYFNNDSSPIMNFPSSPNNAFAPSPVLGSTMLTISASSLSNSSSSNSTTTTTPTNEKIATIQTTLPSAIQNPLYLHHQGSPQTHEHFLKLLNQIQQHHHQSSSFQSNHEIINAHTAAAVLSQSNSSTSSPNLLVPLINMDHSNTTSLLSNDQMILDTSSLIGNGIQYNIPDQSSIVPTISTSNGSVPIQQYSNRKTRVSNTNIQSPPNSPRKTSTRINNKIKAKTQQVQQNIQANLSPNSSSSTTPTLSPTMNSTGLSGFNLNSISNNSNSPPHSPPLAPPIPTVIVTKSPNSRKSIRNTNNVGPNVSSIISQLGYGNAMSASSNSIALSPSNSFVNSSSTSSCTDLSTSQTNLNNSSSNNNSNNNNNNNNEDKKAICLGFLKYFFNVNLSSQTPSLRRSLILSLYVNKIPQEQRYRRPNDMANLCVVLYGFLFSSLDEQTIKEFINSHSSNSTKSKKEDKKKKRKRESKHNSKEKEHNNNHNTNNNNNNNEDVDNPNKSLKSNSSINSIDNWTSLDLTQSNIEQQSHMDTEHNNNNNNNTHQASDDDDPPISLHDAFVNCLKSCNLLPFLEFKPVQSLPLPVDLPISDSYYTFDDLVRWENELKDLKLSVKQQTQHQLKLQKHQQLLQQSSPSSSSSPQLSASGNIPLTPSFLSLQHQVITPSNSSSSLLGDLQPQSPITQSINNALSLPILNNTNDINIHSSLNNNNNHNILSSNLINNNSNPTSPTLPSPTLPSPSPTISSNSIDTSLFINSSNNMIQQFNSNMMNSGVLVNVYESDESFVIYVAIPHSQTNSLKVTVNQLEIIVEGIISIPDTIYLPNGTEIQVPICDPLVNGLQRKEFQEGSFSKQIQLSSPVSSSVVGKREGVIVIIAQKESSQPPQYVSQI